MYNDDLNKRRPQDSSKISLTEPWEIRYWCQKFNISEGQLRAAVAYAGHGAKAVEEFLKSRK